MLNTYDRDGVTVVELDRGPVNALDLELLGALTAAFDRADSPVVLTGAGRTLSAGVDLRRIVEEPDSYVPEFLAALSRAFLAVFTHPRPTVAAINGHAIAGGCLFALCCDARVMSAGTIGLTELAIGVRFPAPGWRSSATPSERRPAGWCCARTPWTGTRRCGSVSSTKSPSPPCCSTGRWRSPPSWAATRPRPTPRPSATCSAQRSRPSAPAATPTSRPPGVHRRPGGGLPATSPPWRQARGADIRLSRPWVSARGHTWSGLSRLRP